MNVKPLQLWFLLLGMVFLLAPVAAPQDRAAAREKKAPKPKDAPKEGDEEKAPERKTTDADDRTHDTNEDDKDAKAPEAKDAERRNRGDRTRHASTPLGVRRGALSDMRSKSSDRIRRRVRARIRDRMRDRLLGALRWKAAGRRQ